MLTSRGPGTRSRALTRGFWIAGGRLKRAGGFGGLGDEVVDFVAGDGDFSKFVWGER